MNIKRKKFSDEIYNHFLISNGTILLGYKATDVYDIVNVVSQDSFKMVNPSFADWLDKYTPYLPDNMPVAIEISGKEFSDKEKTVITDAIWDYYHVCVAKINKQRHSDILTMIWFIASFVLSGLLILLYSTANLSSTVTVQFVYVPIWFFGYRILNHLILGIGPRNRDRRFCEQLGSMKVLFPGVKPNNEIFQEQTELIKNEFNARRTIKSHHDYLYIQNRLTADDNTVRINCYARDVDDLIEPCSVDGYELPSYLYDSFMSCVAPFVVKNADVEICISGTELSDEEQNKVVRAISNETSFDTAKQNDLLRENGARIIVFFILLILVAVAMRFKPDSLDAVVTETIYILFWFFADYLVEFLILEPIEAVKAKKTALQFRNANIVFKPKRTK